MTASDTREMSKCLMFKNLGFEVFFLGGGGGDVGWFISVHIHVILCSAQHSVISLSYPRAGLGIRGLSGITQAKCSFCEYEPRMDQLKYFEPRMVE